MQDRLAIAGSARLSTLAVYSYYRVFLAAALLLVFILNHDRLPVPRRGGSSLELYLLVSAAYVALALVSSLLARLLVASEQRQGSILIAIDVLVLSLLAHASGGAASHVAPLLVVTVAASAILLQRRAPYFVAATATLAMLYSQVIASLAAGTSPASGSTQVGLLGLAFFGIVAATSQLTGRLQQSEALARQKAGELSELEQLNSHIIQRMRTGILVVDADGRVRLANNAAQQMLLPGEWRGQAARLEELSPELSRRIAAWQQDAAQRFPPLRNHPVGPEMDTSMTALQLGERPATLVFLEDLAARSQHLQQMKLASLGRLTASIAHEIRNPLSAINHAAQLLGESSQASSEDHRLTEIIQQQALRLDRIVENVLQLSRRQMPRTDLLEIGSWLRQFRHDYLATHSGGDALDIELPAGPQRARFDPNHLQQILQNLCDNGLRHGRTHAGQGHVTLQVSASTQDDVAVLRIFDNGPGISADKIGNLFEPFFTTDAKGTGLGLYIARELCEANRARLSYVPASDSAPGYFQITFAHPGRIAS